MGKKMKFEREARIIQTGTQAYGPLSEDSDHDFVMLGECASALKELLKMLEIKVHDSRHIHPTYEGFYFMEKNRKVQIIVAFDDIEFKAWEETTEWMKAQDPIEDRYERISIFRQMFHNIWTDKMEYR